VRNSRDAACGPNLAIRTNRGTNAFPAGNAEFSRQRNHAGGGTIVLFGRLVVIMVPSPVVMFFFGQNG